MRTTKELFKLKRLLAEEVELSEQARKYGKLADLAKELGLSLEVERLEAMAGELESDADDKRGQLLLLGYDPDRDWDLS